MTHELAPQGAHQAGDGDLPQRSASADVSSLALPAAAQSAVGIFPLVITVPGEPRGKGRPRFARVGAGVRAYTDGKTASYENLVKHEAALVMAGRALLDEALMVIVHAYMPIPASWSGKKQARALAGLIRPTGRPDCDNFAKCLDALNKIVWRDDAAIVSLTVIKRYAAIPKLVISIDQCPPAEFRAELEAA